MYPIPNFFIPLLCGLLAVIPVSARDIPSSLFMAKEEVPPLIKKAEERGHDGDRCHVHVQV